MTTSNQEHSDSASEWRKCLPSNTVAVVVTYGNRVQMAVETLARIFSSGITRAVLVDNGLKEPVRIALAAQLKALGGSVNVRRLPTNQGSAAGFAAGIAQAQQDGAEFLWLLDDDNHPQPEAFLNAAASLNLARSRKRRAAVSCLRTADPSHLRIAAGEAIAAVYPRAGEFFGFDLFSRFAPKPGRPASSADGGSAEASDAVALIPVAPYGGLLLASTDIDLVGPPDGRFVLYCDDYDFTQRLVKNGVELQLVSTARVDDAGQRWESQDSRSNMKSMMMNSSGWRAYYLFRNLRVLESRQARQDGKMLRFFLNECVYTAMVLIRSLRARKLGFARLFLEAQSDARHGRLGLKYQLPQ